MNLLSQAGEVQQVWTEQGLPWEGVTKLKPFGDPAILILRAAYDEVLDLSTCNPGTNARTSIGVYDADDLALVSYEGGAASSSGACVKTLGVRVAAGHSYLIILGQDDPSQVKIRESGQAVDLSISASGQR